MRESSLDPFRGPDPPLPHGRLARQGLEPAGPAQDRP